MLNFVKIGFLEIRIWDILDILLVAILMYQVYKLLKGGLAFNIFIGFLLVYFIYQVVDILEMKVLSNILGQFIAAGFLAIFIVFQPEIRRFLLFVGRGSGIGERNFWKRFLSQKVKEQTGTERSVNQLSRAINQLAFTKTGALIVFTESSEQYFFGNTGVILNADISNKLLETIFQKNTPLHDGAMVITDNKILAAGCVLPVSENPNLPTRLGMRHKAAVGITEKVDARVLVVSEETGKIAYAYKGRIRQNISQTVLLEALKESLDGGS